MKTRLSQPRLLLPATVVIFLVARGTVVRSADKRALTLIVAVAVSLTLLELGGHSIEFFF